jgi:hypothetical protein
MPIVLIFCLEFQSKSLDLFESAGDLLTGQAPVREDVQINGQMYTSNSTTRVHNKWTQNQIGANRAF